jgi:hypothetical protein
MRESCKQPLTQLFHTYLCLEEVLERANSGGIFLNYVKSPWTNFSDKLFQASGSSSPCILSLTIYAPLLCKKEQCAFRIEIMVFTARRFIDAPSVRSTQRPVLAIVYFEIGLNFRLTT